MNLDNTTLAAELAARLYSAHPDLDITEGQLEYSIKDILDELITAGPEPAQRGGVRAKDRDPPTADTGRGGYYKVENGVQPPVKGQHAAGLSGDTTVMREESYENVDQSSGEECDKGNGGEELAAGSATTLHEDPHS